MPQVEVTFDIDANGILHVSAKDKATGKEQKIRIEASSGLSDAEIDKMVKEAEANAKEDQERRDQIEARNQLDGLVYKVEKDSKEWVDRLAADVKERLDKARGGRQGGTADRRGGEDPLGPRRAQRRLFGGGCLALPERPSRERPRRPPAGRQQAALLRTRQSRPTTRSWTTPPSRNRTVRPEPSAAHLSIM